MVSAGQTTEDFIHHVLVSRLLNAGYAVPSVLPSMIILLVVARRGLRSRQAAALVRLLVTVLTTAAAYVGVSVVAGVAAVDSSRRSVGQEGAPGRPSGWIKGVGGTA